MNDVYQSSCILVIELFRKFKCVNFLHSLQISELIALPKLSLLKLRSSVSNLIRPPNVLGSIVTKLLWLRSSCVTDVSSENTSLKINKNTYCIFGQMVYLK